MIQIEIDGVSLCFETSEQVFSPRQVDVGTLAMLSQVRLEKEDKVLDLGCGYGTVGIWAAKVLGEERVVMVDNNPEAVALSKKNAELNGVGNVKIIESNGFMDLDETGFTMILSNPPYHEDFSVPKHFIEKGFNRLQIGGKLIMVTKRKDWYKNKLISIFGGVQIAEVGSYYVFTGIKKQASYGPKRKR